MPKVWEIVEKFKNLCKFRGWKTSETEDWVEANDKYHNFLWIRDIHPASFKNVISNRRCVVREGLSYHVVEASYTAWLFSETPSEALVKMIFENSTFSKRIAIYDLAPLLEGKHICERLNNTDSPVFQEFESFLRNELKAKLKPLSNVEITSEDYSFAELA